MQIYGCSATGNPPLRGGPWDYGAYAGVFLAYLNLAPSFVNSNLGFRCALSSAD